jgi:transposase
MHSTTIAVDLVKTVFEVAVSRRPGKVSERHRFSRGQLARYLAEQAPATVVMEACGTAHFWGREASARGHHVVLIPPHAVRPYVLRNKTDGAGAKGLLEAVRNGDVRPVPVKFVDQHGLRRHLGAISKAAGVPGLSSIVTPSRSCAPSASKVSSRSRAAPRSL